MNNDTQTIWIIAMIIIFSVAVIGPFLQKWHRENDPHWRQAKALENQQKLFEQFLKYQGGNLPPFDIQQIAHKKKDGAFASFLFFMLFAGIIVIYFYFYYFVAH